MECGGAVWVDGDLISSTLEHPSYPPHPPHRPLHPLVPPYPPCSNITLPPDGSPPASQPTRIQPEYPDPTRFSPESYPNPAPILPYLAPPQPHPPHPSSPPSDPTPPYPDPSLEHSSTHSLFVVASLEPSLIVYERTIASRGPADADPAEGGDAPPLLIKRHSVPTRSACDNLYWDGDSLLSGCHPRALTFVAYSKAPRTRRAPCEVLRFSHLINESDVPALSGTVYRDQAGREYSACTVAAFDPSATDANGGILWLGSVHGFGLLRCQVGA